MEKYISIPLWPWARILVEAQPAGVAAQPAYRARPAS
jgi:hypothetical protein